MHAWINNIVLHADTSTRTAYFGNASHTIRLIRRLYLKYILRHNSAAAPNYTCEGKTYCHFLPYRIMSVIKQVTFLISFLTSMPFLS